eukprot:10815086-Heterocapsa_arctica.AAC.1
MPAAIRPCGFAANTYGNAACGYTAMPAAIRPCGYTAMPPAFRPCGQCGHNGHAYDLADGQAAFRPVRL